MIGLSTISGGIVGSNLEGTVEGLFQYGTPGVWYDASDINNYVPSIVLGNEVLTNGDFSSATGWSTTGIISGGIASIVGASTVVFFQTNVLTAGIWYRVTVNISRFNSGFLYIRVGGNNDNISYVPTVGTRSFYVRSEGTQFSIIGYGNVNNDFDITSVSVRPVLNFGEVSMYRDIAGLLPVTDVEQTVSIILDKRQGTKVRRYNEITGTNDFNWGTFPNRTTLATTNPFGGNDAVLLLSSVGNTAAGNLSAGTFSGGPETYSLYVKNFNTTTTRFGVYNGTAGSFTCFGVITWAGAVPSLSIGGGSGTTNVVSVGNDWYRVSITYTGIFGNNRAVYVYPEESSNPSCTGKGAYFWGAQLEYGSTATTYQQITTGTNVNWTPGNHAYQSTPTSAPVLRARYNLVTYSERIDNGAWGKSGLFVQTNLLTYSEDLENAAWTKTNVNIFGFDPATATQGSELVVNGDFSVGTGWATGGAWVISGGNASLTSSTTILSQAGTAAVAGKWYKVTYTISTISAGSVRIEFGGVNGITRTTAGTYTQYFFATNTNGIVIQPLTTLTASIDNVSIKELTGGLITAPDGTTTAEKIVASQTDSTTRAAYQSFTSTANATHTLSVYVKAAEYTKFAIQEIGGGRFGASFDLTAVTTASLGGLGYVSSAITSVGNGWYRCSVVWTGLAVSNALTFIGYPDSGVTTLNAGGCAYAGDATSGVYVWGAQLVLGSEIGDYRRTFAQTNPVQYMGPTGTLTADYISALGGALAAILQTMPTTAGTHTASIYAKAGTKSVLQFSANVFGWGVDARANFDLQNGVLGTVDAGLTASITAVSEYPGWYRCSVTATKTTSAANLIWCIVDNATSARESVSTAGSIYVWGAQLVPGSSAGTYQRIAAATDYDTVGFKPYLAFDGIDDSLVTNSIDFASGPTNPILGNELVTNGTFASNTAWTFLDATWSISGGVLNAVNGTSFNTYQDIAITIGNWYRVSYDLTITSGSFSIRLGNQGAGSTRTTSGTYTEYVRAAGAGLQIYMMGSGTFNGSVDNISVKAIDSAYAPDKMTLCAGITKLSDAATAVVTELSATSGSNSGVFVLFAPGSPASKRFGFNSNGNAASVAEAATTDTAYNALFTAVLTGQGNISGDLVTLRANTTQVASGTADQGTGNYGNYPLYIGRRNNASLPFNGRLYSLIIASGQATNAQVNSVERYVAGKTGITL